MVDRNGLIPPNSTFSFIVPEQHHRERLDKFLAQQFALYSRSFFQKVIEDGCVTVNNNAVTKSGASIAQGDTITVTFPPQLKPDLATIAQHAPGIDIVYENEHFFIINKPAGLIVHRPSTHSTQASLADWITHHHQEIKDVGYIDRPGIVHRLDKDTSGLLIIPRTNHAHAQFSHMFKQRMVHKTYRALVSGHPEPEGSIDLFVGRHQTQIVKMAAFRSQGSNSTIREALTHYKVLEYLDNAALLEVKPVTGRTHQIRVHCAALGHPLLGDSVYGSASPLINRHALHAQSLEFTFDGQHFSFSRNPPEDFTHALEQLRQK